MPAVRRSISSIASPELTPGPAPPSREMALMPLKRASVGGPPTQDTWLKAEKGTISPAVLRAYQ
ncbi:hypothetical protein D3C72_2550170 [compost metagenome]